MRLKSLRLHAFRNLLDQQVSLSAGINFFVGENGQGKTNFLEAIHLLGRGQSFRPTQPSSFLRHSPARASAWQPAEAVAPGSPRAKATGVVAGENFDDLIEMVFDVGRRTATLNGKRASAADLMRTAPSVLFSPESLAAIKEGPEQRRRLLDELVLMQAPRQARLIAEHAKALKSRNRLLRDIAHRERISETARRELRLTLASLDRIYFLLCTHLTDARIQALRAISEDLQNAMAFVSDSEIGDISVEYLISDQSALAWSESQIYDAICKRSVELSKQEQAAGASLVGPHKHDIRFLFRGEDSRFYCSQGQQRALILCFKIAQIVYHQRVHQTYPILLLDDVLSELDAKRRVGLMKFLDSVSAQVLMTATDLTWSDHFERSDNTIFSVIAGSVEARSL